MVQTTSAEAAIGLGCSLGDRHHRLELTVRKLHATLGIHITRVSRFYRTPPMHGGNATGWFLNAVVRLVTHLDPDALLARCQDLEAEAGRRRAQHWGDRTLDLDLLLYAGRIVDSASLTLPHPAIATRPFVLQPLLEVWPDAVDPRSQTRYAELDTGSRPDAIAVAAVDPRAIRARDLRPAPPSTHSPPRPTP